VKAWDEKGERESLRKTAEAQTARAQWYKERTAAVKARVSAPEVLRHNGINLKYGGAREEQISCPFHGADVKPSARVYPGDAQGPSHVWCYTCQKRWDAIGLWKEFGGDPDVKFSRVIAEMERAFGITPPEAPTWEIEESGPTESEEYAFALLEVCERRLREARPVFDLRSHLLIGQLLDRCRVTLEGRQVHPDEVSVRLRLVLDKIGDKLRRDDAPVLGGL
jgi:hypothetical protein